MEFIGTEGKKISGKFTLVYVKEVPNGFNYGRTHLWRFNFVAEGGEKVMLTTNAKVVDNFITQEAYGLYREAAFAIGKTFNLEFIVKKHLQYGNFKTTIVKNAKLIENIREVA
jgi:hypothetical protein|tara:strand:+ start:906 stop:1244 length:339 start_codon:yes stop_codon:yes gene_type:complete